MPDAVAEIRTEIDPGQHDVDLVLLRDAERYAVGGRAVHALGLDHEVPRPLVRERARRGDRVPGRGALDVWRDDARLAEVGRSAGERGDAGAVNTIVIGNQNSHDI
jgi:hypothetical protein